MPSAVRVSDSHVCPVHGGGPVAGPGCPTVLIGGQPAARVRDVAACPGAPDAIIFGSATVFMGGMPAARTMDATAHGGFLGPGCPTVLIGGPKVVFPVVHAFAAKKPSEREREEIQAALDSNQPQFAIDLTLRYFGIDASNVPGGPHWNPTESNYGTTRFSGAMDIGTPALVSPDVLASTLVHETTHANQAAMQRARGSGGTEWPDGAGSVNYDEAGAYQAELQSAGNTGLVANQPEHQLAKSRLGDHYDQLPALWQTAFDDGKYPP